MNDLNTPGLRVVEATIADLRAALESGAVTSVDLVAAYLNRIAHYDRHGIRLNAVPVLNDNVFDEAMAADRRRRTGQTLGPLDGIPYTTKASYKVKGLPVSSGSPAFENLIASDDAFAIERLRAAGAVVVGLTNMPPMANGGMQRGLYGRAESPYNPVFLAAAYGSGSSNGSGVATATSMAAFGLGEETWSSGRAPASNNGLVAYTPSRGVISMRGNWPLFPTMDVVVPHTRTVQDMLEILDVLVVDDTRSTGDFWRTQQHVRLPLASEVRPDDFGTLARTDALEGKRLGVPRMYINADPDNQLPIRTRDSVLSLWETARKDLEALGAEVVEVDFPAVSRYDEDRPGARSMVARGLVPAEFAEVEEEHLVACVWNDFLRTNGQEGLDSFATVDPDLMFPIPPGFLTDPDDESGGTAVMAVCARDHTITLADIPGLADGLIGLERTRKIDLEEWLDEHQLDALVFPANADVGRHDADVNPKSAEHAWRNGVAFSNGNAAIRHLGIPTVTVPMGVMHDLGMPVGLTFAGRAYSDADLLAYAFAFEQTAPRREPPARTPDLGHPAPHLVAAGGADNRTGATPAVQVTADLSEPDATGAVVLTIRGSADDATCDVFVNGDAVAVTTAANGSFEASATLNSLDLARLHSHWRGPYGALVVVVAHSPSGTAGAVLTVGGI